MVPVVVKPQIDTTAATTPPKTFVDRMPPIDIPRGQCQMPAVTSPPGNSQMGLGSEERQLHKVFPVLSLDWAPDPTQILNAKPVEPISFYPCI